MIVSFKNKGSEDVFDGINSKESTKSCPPDIVAIARRKLDQINSAISINDLKIPPGNRLEPLKGDRKGQYPHFSQAIATLLPKPKSRL